MTADFSTSSAFSLASTRKLYKRPLFELVGEAHAGLKEHFTPGELQTSRLLSIKTGGCPEDCAYCPQAARYHTGVDVHTLLPLEEVVKEARRAKEEGATRFCMGAAWREVRDGKHFDRVLDMVRAVASLDLQVCCTLGMLTKKQATRLKEAGLFAYNHNIDTSESYYKDVISTRNYKDRLQTIEHVRKAGITVCTGGIIGMGETDQDRIAFLHQLACLSPQPESITINKLIAIKGTPMAEMPEVSTLVLLRVVACARLLIPKAVVRLSAGRESLSEAEQFLLFYAGANSVFLGETLLTAPNPSQASDARLFENLGLQSCRMGDTQEADTLACKKADTLTET